LLIVLMAAWEQQAHAQDASTAKSDSSITAYGGDRFLTETADPIKIGQQIKRLHKHAHGHERRHVQQMFRD